MGKSVLIILGCSPVRYVRVEEKTMPITEFLERNAQMWGDDTALVEINPENEKNRT